MFGKTGNKEQQIRDGFSNMYNLRMLKRPDTYKASFNRGRTPTGDTNQCLVRADNLEPYNYGFDANGDKCKKNSSNMPFNVINDGEAFSMHGVMNACYADGSTRTINDNVDLRVFECITRAGGEVEALINNDYLITIEDGF